MSSNQTKSLVTFTLTFLLFVSLIILNFYNSVVTENILFINPILIPILSGVIIFCLMLVLWYRQTENDRVLYEFFTIVTHKFNTPLTGLRWAIQILHKELSYQEKEDLLSQMEKADERLMEIVGMLVGFVKFDQRLEYAYEAASLREMIDDTLQKYGASMHQKNISFNINATQTISTLIIDRRKMQFVIDMLFDNAIKYTPAGGSITAIIVQDSRSITLSIKDSGIGMTPSDIRKLFKQFYRSEDAKKVDTEGMGLGLYTIRKIVEHHRGKLWATSEGKGKGSTFHLQLYLK